LDSLALGLGGDTSDPYGLVRAISPSPLMSFYLAIYNYITLYHTGWAIKKNQWRLNSTLQLRPSKNKIPANVLTMLLYVCSGMFGYMSQHNIMKFRDRHSSVVYGTVKAQCCCFLFAPLLYDNIICGHFLLGQPVSEL